MQQIRINSVIKRSSPFFASDQSTSQSQLAFLKQNAINIIQINLQCAGGGYFPLYLQKMQKNLIDYITLCLKTFGENLSTIKLTFNGFDVQNGIFQKIMQILLKNRGHPKRLHFHTNNLTNLLPKHFETMLKLIVDCGSDINVQDLSVEMMGWKFQSVFGFKSMRDCFYGFFAGQFTLHFKNFRLEMSAWNLDQKTAQRFLESTTEDVSVLQDLIFKKVIGRNGLPVQKLIQNLSLIDQQIAKNVVAMFINKSQNKMYDQMKNEPQAQRFRDMTNKSIVQLLRDARVQLFHRQMVKLINSLLDLMPLAQNFTIDMRNWHGIYKMSELQRRLQSKVSATRNQFSIIQSKRFKKGGKGKSFVEEQRPIKILYMM